MTQMDRSAELTQTLVELACEISLEFGQVKRIDGQPVNILALPNEGTLASKGGRLEFDDPSSGTSFSIDSDDQVNLKGERELAAAVGVLKQIQARLEAQRRGLPAELYMPTPEAGDRGQVTDGFVLLDARNGEDHDEPIVAIHPECVQISLLPEANIENLGSSGDTSIAVIVIDRASGKVLSGISLEGLTTIVKLNFPDPSSSSISIYIVGNDPYSFAEYKERIDWGEIIEGTRLSSDCILVEPSTNLSFSQLLCDEEGRVSLRFYDHLLGSMREEDITNGWSGPV